MTFTDFKKKRKEKEAQPPCRFALVHPACIFQNPNAPRKANNPHDMDLLTDSIRQNGILTPLIARVLRDDGWTTDRYELIDGTRRLQVAKALALPHVPLIIWEDTERRRAYEMSLILHTQQKPLNVFELADALEIYMRREGHDCHRAATALSLPPAELDIKLSILSLSAVERNIICEHGLTERHARALLRVKQPTYRLFVLNAIVENGFNVTESENYIDSFLLHPEKHLLFEVFSPNEEKEPSQTDPPLRKAVFRDSRLFVNTLDRALKNGRAFGVPIDAEKKETPQGLEYTIRVGKS